ncbi:sialate O-acetylesterase-like [Paramacrobiotus metropolitanus]|uniref:sialate O-acetylesterase-like n=1 Tax=Paramacrobiotus metropolitanus TaxID=2943436 RepID=UPI002445A997|nr:sialate O-acetylesterase-like [Paramacrobiotus metropolitanus]
MMTAVNFVWAALLLCCSGNDAVLLRNRDIPVQANRSDAPEPNGPWKKLRIANIFHDGMILSATCPGSRLWGYGEPGAHIIIDLRVDVYDTRVNGNGKWETYLCVDSPGGPLDIEVIQQIKRKHAGHAMVRGVYFGEVYLCAGEGNMAFPVKHMRNGTAELLASSDFPFMRIMTIYPSTSPVPLTEPHILQNWTKVTPDTLRYFSAICWTTMRRVYARLNHKRKPDEQIPIGLIGAYYDNTTIRTWTPPEAIKQCNNKRNMSVEPGKDSAVFNGMIAPLTKFRLSGVLWYQGESDAATNPEVYGCRFKALINAWQGRYPWAEGLPFGIVQLGTQSTEKIPGGTALVRWQQTAHYGQLPNKALPRVFMASAFDLDDPGSPFGSRYTRHKEEIAERLFAGIMSQIYYIHLPFQGPFPKQIQTDSDQIIIEYDTNVIYRKDHPKECFQVCCHSPTIQLSSWHECKVWHNVTTNWIRSEPNKVFVGSATCGKHAGFVRYAWQLGNLKCKVYISDYLWSSYGLPGAPFVLPTNWTQGEEATVY